MNHPHAGSYDPSTAPTFWINYASRSVMRRFEERLRPLGFGVAYLPVVVALEQNGPMQQKELLAHARIEQPTLTALLARMERDQLVVRRRDPSDARARQVTLTPRAMSVLAQVTDEMEAVVEAAMAGISDTDRVTLVRALRAVVQNLDEQELREEGQVPRGHDD